MSELHARDFNPYIIGNLKKIYTSGDFSFYYDPKSELDEIFITQKLVDMEVTYLARLIVDKGHSMLVVIYGDAKRSKRLKSLYYAGTRKVDNVEFLIKEVFNITKIKEPRQQRELKKAIRKVLLTELFDVEIGNSFWTCYLVDEVTLLLVLRPTLTTIMTEPGDEIIEYAYAFRTLNDGGVIKNESDFLYALRYVVHSFKEIGGKELAEALKKGLTKIAF